VRRRGGGGGQRGREEAGYVANFSNVFGGPIRRGAGRKVGADEIGGFGRQALPDAFVRIRHVGLVADRGRRAKLARCRALSAQAVRPVSAAREPVAAPMLRLTGVGSPIPSRALPAGRKGTW
jgi:hypothetical protein